MITIWLLVGKFPKDFDSAFAYDNAYIVSRSVGRRKFSFYFKGRVRDFECES